MSFGFTFTGTFDDNNLPTDVERMFLNEPNRFCMQHSTSRERGSVHMHDYMQLWYCLRGSFRRIYNGQTYQHNAGDFLFVPPFIPHAIDTSDSADVEFIFCDLSMEYFNTFTGGNDNNTLFSLVYLRPLFTYANQGNPSVSFSADTAQKMEQLYFELLREYERANELSPVYLRTILARIFTLVTNEYVSNVPKNDDFLFGKYRDAIQDALDYTKEHFTENIYLKDISKIAMMSTRSFSYVFKQITGKTFVEYLHFLRVRRARELLVNTDMSLVSICCECGFYDALYFSRIFKKVIGFSPSVYRKNEQLQRVYVRPQSINYN